MGLIHRIANASDALALREFHETRTPFNYRDRRALRLVDYVELLRQGSCQASWAGFSSTICDQAYDLTIDKFSNIPSDNRRGRGRKRDGPDCRVYFRAFLTKVSRVMCSQPASRDTEAEVRAARLLQTLVTRHFHLSCLECQRRSRALVSRYFWKVGDGVLCLWLPSYVHRRERQAWLARTIKDVDPRRPGERERIQSIIDCLLRMPKFVQLNDPITACHGACAEDSGDPALAMEAMSVHGLAEAVAQEKAANIERQRPAVQALGTSSLKRMIIEIFGALSDGGLDDGKVARRFGLSKATYSRFAGSRWSQSGGAGVPDLWANTAAMLAGNPIFVEAAQEAGVWRRVGEVLRGPRPVRRSAGHA